MMKREHRLQHILPILMSVIIGIVLLFVGFFFARPILELMSTPDDIINLAEVYLKRFYWGSFCHAL